MLRLFTSNVTVETWPAAYHHYNQGLRCSELVLRSQKTAYILDSAYLVDSGLCPHATAGDARSPEGARRILTPYNSRPGAQVPRCRGP